MNSTSHGGWGALALVLFALVIVSGAVFGFIPSALFLAPAMYVGERLGDRRFAFGAAGTVAGLLHFAASAAFLEVSWRAPWEWQHQLELVGPFAGFGLATMAGRDPTLGLAVAAASAVAGCAAGMIYARIALSGRRLRGERGCQSVTGEPAD